MFWSVNFSEASDTCWNLEIHQIQLPQASLSAPWRLFATTAGLQDGLRPTKVGHWESASEERCGWPGRKKHQMDVRIKSVGRVELLVVYGNLVFKIFNMWIINDVCITLCWNGRVMYYPLLVLTIWQRYIDWHMHTIGIGGNQISWWEMVHDFFSEKHGFYSSSSIQEPKFPGCKVSPCSMDRGHCFCVKDCGSRGLRAEAWCPMSTHLSSWRRLGAAGTE